jgi:hypothetical protein
MKLALISLETIVEVDAVADDEDAAAGSYSLTGTTIMER